MIHMDLSGLASPAEYSILAVLIASLTQNVKQTKIPNEYMTFVSWGIGIAAGLIAVWQSGDTNWVGGALAGLITAASTNGGVDAVKTIASKAKASSEAKLSAAVDAAREKNPGEV